MNEHSNTILKAEHLEKKVASPGGQLTILKDVNLTLNLSGSLAIVGVSGSGKSTLLSLLAGLDTPTNGRVIFNNIDLNTLDEDGRARLRNKQVGFVFQSFQLLKNLTAIENVMLPLELGGIFEARNIALEQLSDIGLNNRLHHYPNQLSGGEQQRVAIARAFVTKPKILFADEPTGNLDQETARNIFNLLFKLNNDYRTTLVLVTHDQNIAKTCDQRLTLAGGQIIQEKL